MEQTERPATARLVDALMPAQTVIATEVGASPASLHSWSTTRRNPRPDARRALAEVARARAAQLVALADEVDPPAEGGGEA